MTPLKGSVEMTPEQIESLVDSKLLSLRNRKNTAVKVLAYTAIVAGAGFTVGTMFGGLIF